MPAKLIIKKRLIQATKHQLKPSVNAIARLPLDIREIMLDSFGHETLFKKAIMLGARPGRAGDNNNSVFESKILDAFFKREESLEITVSSLMIGQTYVGDSIWDALGFELVAKRAFDTMLVLLQTIHEFDEERIYLGAANSEIISKPEPISTPLAQIKQANRVRTSAAGTGAGDTNAHHKQGTRSHVNPDTSPKLKNANARIARALTDEIAT